MSFYPVHKKTKKRELRAKQIKQNANSLQGHRAYINRHGVRLSELGRQTEGRVASILAEKLKTGELVSFTHHPAYSQEDKAGKDFTVSVLVDGQALTASFGVTISPHPYPFMNEIVIPHNMTDERIWYRIHKICQEQANKQA